MFITSTTLNFQLKHNPQTKRQFCPRKAQTSQLLSRNSNRSKLRCEICRSCVCKKHTHFYCETCVCDIRLGTVVPVKIPVVDKPRKCSLKSETCPSTTKLHCMNCLKSFCQKLLQCVCSPNCSSNEEA